MKTQKQLDAIKIGEDYLESEVLQLDSLVEKVLAISKAYEPLLGPTGPGNTHRDNIDVDWYGKHLMNRINCIIDMWISRSKEGRAAGEKYREQLHYKLQDSPGFKYSTTTRY